MAGTPVSDDLLRHVAPLGWNHISLTGDYLWTQVTAPDRLHEEISADYKEMIYAGTTPGLNPGEEIATKRNALIRKWRLEGKAVADSLELAYPVDCQFGELMIICRNGPSRLSDNSSRVSAGFPR